MADLRAAHLEIGQPPFFDIGVNLFGLFLVKQRRMLLSATGAILHA